MAAVAQGQVQDGALPMLLDIEHWVLALGPVVVPEPWRLATEFRLQQYLQVAVGMHEVLFIGGLEILKTCYQGVLRVSHRYRVGFYRRMGPEHGAQGINEQRCPVRGLKNTVGHQADDGIGPVQCIPAPTVLDPVTQTLLRRQRGHHIAGVADQEVGLGEGFQIFIIFKNPNPNPVKFRQ